MSSTKNASFDASGYRKKCPRSVKIADRILMVDASKLDMFFNWMAERDRIRRKRASGLPPPWTDDPILLKQKFCNVFRIHDRGTQYILNEIINKGDQTFHEVFFRVILFKMFNRVSTWETMNNKLGPLRWVTFNMKEYGKVLCKIYQLCPLYTGAYQIPPPNLGYSECYINHLALLKMMMDDDLPGELLQLQSMREAFKVISRYPGMGPFLSYQLILDLNNTPHLNFSENEWASYGPGSKKCLQLIFGNVNGIESEAIKYLYFTQMDHFNRLGIADPPMVSEGSRPGVSIVDIEHSLCEAAKYDRGTGFRCKWRSNEVPVTSNIPPKDVRRETSTGFSSFVATPLPSTLLGLPGVGGKNSHFFQRDVARGESPPSEFFVEEFDREATPLWHAGYEDDDTEYEISHIIQERLCTDGWEFKVRWEGWSPKHDTWLPERALNNASSVLKAWKKTHPKSTTGMVKRKKERAKSGGNRPRRRKDSSQLKMFRTKAKVTVFIPKL